MYEHVNRNTFYRGSLLEIVYRMSEILQMAKKAGYIAQVSAILVMSVSSSNSLCIALFTTAGKYPREGCPRVIFGCLVAM